VKTASKTKQKQEKISDKFLYKGSENSFSMKLIVLLKYRISLEFRGEITDFLSKGISSEEIFP